MFAVIFLISSFLGGFGLITGIAKKNQLDIWGHIAAGTGVGYLLSGWITYIVSYFAKVVLDSSNPKIYGNLAAVSIMFLVAAVTLRKSKYTVLEKASKKESLFFMILFVFILFTMFYVFHVTTGNGTDNMLSSGATVFSDFSPHTAMIRSFSMHDNFPTQYPHYGGVDVKYHFMFQFLAGNLEYLGMRIDFAFNWISAASLWGFLVLLYLFAKQITGFSAVGWITIVMFFCRSSLAGLEKFVETIMSGNWDAFWSNAEFIGYTNHEDWGLWNYNVFLNQRHLGFGLLIAMIVIMYFANKLNWMDKFSNEKSESVSIRIKNGIDTFVKSLFLSKAAWMPSSEWTTAAFLGCMLGLLSFWNGAVVVATLLILCGFGFFSKNKLDYAIAAGVTVLLALLQTNFFMDKDIGQNISTKYYFGFLADELTMHGVLLYILRLSGIFFIGVILFLLIFKTKFKVMIFSFLLPVAFAFTVSMTPDIAVNHKYIIISTIFLNIFWGYALVKMWHEKRGMENVILKFIAAILFFLLIITGAYDLITIYNSDKNTVEINLDSTLTEWLEENVKEDDLVLTGEDSMSETTLSGIMLYNGWPYYAWSAGYDTDTRAQNAIRIYTSNSQEEVKELVKKEGISYIIYEDGMTYEENECKDDVLKQIYDCVFEEGNIKIYKTA